MAAPAGPCEWCGGPQQWTVVAGEMYVRCVAGCQSLFPEGPATHLLDSERFPLRVLGGLLEPSGKEVGKPLEGGAAGEYRDTDEEVIEPPVGWLSTLWEGGWDGSQE